MVLRLRVFIGLGRKERGQFLPISISSPSQKLFLPMSPIHQALAGKGDERRGEQSQWDCGLDLVHSAYGRCPHASSLSREGSDVFAPEDSWPKPGLLQLTALNSELLLLHTLHGDQAHTDSPVA